MLKGSIATWKEELCPGRPENEEQSEQSSPELDPPQYAKDRLEGTKMNVASLFRGSTVATCCFIPCSPPTFNAPPFSDTFTRATPTLGPFRRHC